MFCTDLGTLIISPHSINRLVVTTDNCILHSMHNILYLSLELRWKSRGPQIPQNSRSHFQILGARRVTRHKPHTEEAPFRSDLRIFTLSARALSMARNFANTGQQLQIVKISRATLKNRSPNFCAHLIKG